MPFLAFADVFPPDSVTVTGYMNGGCTALSGDVSAPQNANGDCFFIGDRYMDSHSIPSEVLPQSTTTILATKLFWVQNGGVVPTTGYASVGCDQTPYTFVNFLDALQQENMSSMDLTSYLCPKGHQLFIQNQEPDDGALLMFVITYVPHEITASSSALMQSYGYGNIVFELAIIIVFVMIGYGAYVWKRLFGRHI